MLFAFFVYNRRRELLDDDEIYSRGNILAKIGIVLLSGTVIVLLTWAGEAAIGAVDFLPARLAGILDEDVTSFVRGAVAVVLVVGVAEEVFDRRWQVGGRGVIGDRLLWANARAT